MHTNHLGAKTLGNFNLRSAAGPAAAVALAMATAGAVAACGSSTASAGTTSRAQLSAVAAAVSTDHTLPKWTAPGPSLNASGLRGKRIYVIPITSQSPFEIQVEKADQEAAAAAGVKLTFYRNQGSVAEWVQGMNAAIAAKPDLIFLESAPDPRQLAPQLQAAKAAGIPVVASHIWDASDPNPPACVGCQNLTAIVRGPFAEAGRMMADWVINDSKGKANVLMVGIQGINSGDIVDAAEQSEYKKNCPGCTVKTVSLSLDQIGGGALAPVSTALTSNPSTTYVVPTFDLLISGTLASMNTSGRTGAKVVSFGGSADAMAQVADPTSPVAADVAEPIAWTAYANLDQALRLMAGLQPVKEATPARIFDKSNISQAGSAPAFDEAFGSDFKAGFLKVWKVAS